MTEKSALEEITVERFTLLLRIIHWVNVACGAVLALTGWLIYAGLPAIGPYHIYRNLHVILGLFLIVWNLFHLCYLAITGDLKQRIYGKDHIRQHFAELKVFLGLSPEPPKMEEFTAYDAEKGRYRYKYDPGEMLGFYLWILMFIVIALTGLTMTFPKLLAWTIRLVGTPFIRAAHLSVSYAVIFILVLHIYGSLYSGWSTEKFRLLKSMIWGKERAKIYRRE